MTALTVRSCRYGTDWRPPRSSHGPGPLRRGNRTHRTRHTMLPRSTQLQRQLPITPAYLIVLRAQTVSPSRPPSSRWQHVGRHCTLPACGSGALPIHTDSSQRQLGHNHQWAITTACRMAKDPHHNVQRSSPRADFLASAQPLRDHQHPIPSPPRAAIPDLRRSVPEFHRHQESQEIISACCGSLLSCDFQA